ncbi:hypothetical protein B0H16DRAFT_237905 [Mycena metata]|uniref:F-box domain-containing protein n=1 Tax=Mycena metata TaxID=1033252 RepID=A0AAD7JQZ7_9AGAR|nr:hypothetical protein B0H16DRAFT_237905 [Mycena metata]
MPSSQYGTDTDFPPSGSRHYILLNSNEAPVGAELDMVKFAMLKADAHLACLDDIISKADAGLGQLAEQRASLSSYRARNRAILSPLRRVPPEILVEIFL